MSPYFRTSRRRTSLVTWVRSAWRKEWTSSVWLNPASTNWRSTRVTSSSRTSTDTTRTFNTRASVYTRALVYLVSSCDKCWTFFFFFNKFFKDISPFCGSIGILFWTFALDFKARVDLWIACFLACMRWIPEINLRCNTCWPRDSQHDRWAVFDPHTCARIFKNWWDKCWTFKLYARFSAIKCT